MTYLIAPTVRFRYFPAIFLPAFFCYSWHIAGLPGVYYFAGRCAPESAALGMSELAHSLPWSRDEAQLVMELQAGSDAAFDYLVTYYHAGVYNLVYGILADAADAADVTQDVFLRVFRGIRGFRGGSSLKTWLYRVSVRQALNHRRWCWRHHRQQISIDAEDDGRTAMDLPDEEATPFEQLATREMQSTVRRALAAVPPLFRSAVILRDLEGLSYEEIAEILEVSVGTVKSRILRGRRTLKEILDPVLHPVRPRVAPPASGNHATIAVAGRPGSAPPTALPETSSASHTHELAIGEMQGVGR